MPRLFEGLSVSVGFQAKTHIVGFSHLILMGC